jgi:hypothetical protein
LSLEFSDPPRSRRATDPYSSLLLCAGARMAGIDKGIDAVAMAFTQVAKDEEEKLIKYVNDEFANDPNLRFRIATFLKNPALRAILQGNYGAQPGGLSAAPTARPPKETKLHPSITKFSHLARHLNSI